MTQKNVIDLARESGLHKMIQVKHVVDKVYEIPSEKLERFAALVRAETLEEAAKLCEQGTGDAIQTETLKLLLQERGRIASVIRGLK